VKGPGSITVVVTCGDRIDDGDTWTDHMAASVGDHDRRRRQVSPPQAVERHHMLFPPYRSARDEDGVVPRATEGVRAAGGGCRQCRPECRPSARSRPEPKQKGAQKRSATAELFPLARQPFLCRGLRG